jgi:hypothetical protein
MRQYGGQVDQACGLVDGRRLYRCDLVLAEGLAHDIESARQWGIADRTRATSSSPMMIRASGETKLTRVNDQAIRRVLEAAGVEFIDADGGGPGVRLRGV